MRPDMPKIAVERPRHGHKDRYPRGHLASHYGPELESHPVRESMSWRRYGTKGFSDNLAPLYRFLQSNVGRPWDKVWSELCEHVSWDSTVQRHILGHVFGVVVLHVELRGGVPYASGRGWRYPFHAPLRGTGRWPTLYVCPKSELLRQAPHVARPHRRPKVDPDVVPVGPDERLHRLAGLWYRERLGRDDVGAVVVREKRQLGSKELARLGLVGGPR